MNKFTKSFFFSVMLVITAGCIPAFSSTDQQGYVIAENPALTDTDDLLKAIVAQYPDSYILLSFIPAWDIEGTTDQIITRLNFREELEKAGVKVLFISSGEIPDEVIVPFMTKAGGIHYRLPRESYMSIQNGYELNMTPAFITVDKDGEIHSVKIGGVPAADIFTTRYGL